LGPFKKKLCKVVKNKNFPEEAYKPKRNHLWEKKNRPKRGVKKNKKQRRKGKKKHKKNKEERKMTIFLP